MNSVYLDHNATAPIRPEALAAVTADDDALRGEAADLVYHLLVLLQARGLDWNAVRAELARRAKG